MQFRTQPRKLPTVLSLEKVSALLAAAPGPGLKYRAALSISYGAGLRASEVCNLKVADIDSDRMLIHVDEGKGSKDRKVTLSPGLLELLRDYWFGARPAGWLFPGKPKINPVSSRQLGRAFNSTMVGALATMHIGSKFSRPLTPTNSPLDIRREFRRYVSFKMTGTTSIRIKSSNWAGLD